MKKIFTLAAVVVTLLCSVAYAQQGTVCNAQFNFSVNGNTVQFSPNTINTSALLRHQWLFGDGTGSNFYAPQHSYALPGVYQVWHKVSYRSPNDTAIVVCSDSALREVVIGNPPSCNVHAAFSFVRDSVQTNRLYFSSLSTGTTPNTIYEWRFGDGGTALGRNPVHTYQQSGLYNVCLRVTNSNNCSDDTCMNIQVQVNVNPCNIQAYFSSQADSANSLKFYFTNLSRGISSADSMRWTFGDGSSSASFNAIHTYNQPGTYTVCLRVKKLQPAGVQPCVSEYCKVITVQPAGNCNIIPSFVFRADTLTGNNTITFLNSTQGLSNSDSSFWYFGDGTPVVVNPNNPFTHSYTAPGIYTVCLKVKKVLPGTTTVVCERQVCRTVSVLAPNPCNLQAYFNSSADSINNSLAVYFTNLTANIASTDSVQWSFGDGGGSTAVSPSHTYARGGTYTVCLRVKRTQVPGTAPCVSEYCKLIVLQTEQPCPVTPSFSYYRDSMNSQPGMAYRFNNNSVPQANTDSVFWNFGDGSPVVINNNNPLHVFTSGRSYEVCLTVKRLIPGTNNQYCQRRTCRLVFISGSADSNCVAANVRYVYRRDNYMPNKFYFFAQSDRPLLQQRWTFDKLGVNDTPVVVNQFNPVHVFGDTGLYKVCLRAVTAGGCVKEYCDNVRVYSTALPPQCYLHAYPNPAHYQVSVNVEMQQPGTITASIFSISNVMLLQQVQQGVAGNNRVILNIQNLPRGFYTIRLMYGGRVCHSRFWKI